MLKNKNKILFDSLKKLKLLKMALNFKVTQQYVKSCLNVPKVFCIIFMNVFKPAWSLQAKVGCEFALGCS